jgi:phosphoglycolate phosphatase
MRSVFNGLADKYGFRRIDMAQHERYRDLHGMELLKALDLPIWKLPRVINGMHALMAAHLNGLALFKGVEEMLHGLSACGVRLAIVSSNSRGNVERVLGPATSRLINHYGCGASMFGKAPKIRVALRKTAIPASHAIYIGDEIRDGEAARRATQYGCVESATARRILYRGSGHHRSFV